VKAPEGAPNVLIILIEAMGQGEKSAAAKAGAETSRKVEQAK